MEKIETRIKKWSVDLTTGGRTALRSMPFWDAQGLRIPRAKTWIAQPKMARPRSLKLLSEKSDLHGAAIFRIFGFFLKKNGLDREDPTEARCPGAKDFPVRADFDRFKGEEMGKHGQPCCCPIPLDRWTGMDWALARTHCQVNLPT